MRKLLFTLLFIPQFFILQAQNELSSSTHKVLGAEVDGYQVNIPFSKSFIQKQWDQYAKFLGRNEPAANHLAYQAVFKPTIYDKEILFFAEITGGDAQGALWAGIDPQGVPKDTLKMLQKELKDFVYQFNVSVRKAAAQNKINESEQAATYLSREFEQLKREERRETRNYERNNERIQKYEQELIEMRADSILYEKNIAQLTVKLDSMNIELEKVKKMVELYQQKLEAIE